MASDEVLHLPPEVLKLTHQLEQEKYESLSRRYDVLRKENEILKVRLEKSEKDTHEFVAYFEAELEAKDLRIDALSEELASTEEQSREERAALKGQAEKAYETLSADFEEHQTVSGLKVKTLEDELAQVETFRELKRAMDAKIGELESEVGTLKSRCEEEATTHERKLMVEKAKMSSDLEKKISELRRAAKAEMQKGLAADTLKVIGDNRRMGEELRFQQQVSSELEAEKTRLDAEVKVLRRRLSLADLAESTYAKDAQQRTAENRRLEEKTGVLDELLRSAAKKFQAEKQRLKTGLQADLENSTLDAGALRQMLRLKEKELRQLRKLAETVLQQRTDVEQFFLQALEEVKAAIRRERAENYKNEMANYRSRIKEATNNHRASFPKIRSLQAGRDMDDFNALTTANQQHATMPTAPSAKIHLRELSSEDREHVLRLLFAKINALQSSVPAMPKNSFVGANTFVTTSRGLVEEEEAYEDEHRKTPTRPTMTDGPGSAF